MYITKAEMEIMRKKPNLFDWLNISSYNLQPTFIKEFKGRLDFSRVIHNNTLSYSVLDDIRDELRLTDIFTIKNQAKKEHVLRKRIDELGDFEWTRKVSFFLPTYSEEFIDDFSDKIRWDRIQWYDWDYQQDKYVYYASADFIIRNWEKLKDHWEPCNVDFRYKQYKSRDDLRLLLRLHDKHRRK